MTYEQTERAYHRGIYHGVTAAGDIVQDGGGLKEIEKLNSIVMQLRREQWDSGSFRDETRRRMKEAERKRRASL